MTEPESQPTDITPHAFREGRPDAVLMIGYGTGPADRRDHVRLYLSHSLRDYCEIPADKVVDTRRVSVDRTEIWVRRDTEVEFFARTSRSIEFLEGEIQNRFSGRTMGLLAGVGRGMRRASDPTVCICEKTQDRTQKCPGTSCGLCPGTWSDCPVTP